MTLLPRFHHCAADRTILRTCRAADVRAAEAWFGRLPHGHYVVSAASHACGYVTALPKDRCKACGVREAKAGFRACERCLEAVSGVVLCTRCKAAPAKEGRTQCVRCTDAAASRMRNTRTRGGATPHHIRAAVARREQTKADRLARRAAYNEMLRKKRAEARRPKREAGA